MGPSQILEFLEEGEPPDGCFMAVQPNVGVPERRGGRFIYPQSSPSYFAFFARECVRLGARVVGGCCGTEPHHIAAIAEVVPSLQPRSPDHAVREIEVRVSDPHPDRDTQLSQLGHRLKEGKFVNVVQLDPPKGTNTELVLSAVDCFLESGKAHPLLRPFLNLGVFGSFTTFSALAWENRVVALQSGEGLAAAHLAGSILSGLAAFALGEFLSHGLSGRVHR